MMPEPSAATPLACLAHILRIPCIFLSLTTTRALSSGPSSQPSSGAQVRAAGAGRGRAVAAHRVRRCAPPAARSLQPAASGALLGSRLATQSSSFSCSLSRACQIDSLPSHAFRVSPLSPPWRPVRPSAQPTTSAWRCGSRRRTRSSASRTPSRSRASPRGGTRAPRTSRCACRSAPSMPHTCVRRGPRPAPCFTTTSRSASGGAPRLGSLHDSQISTRSAPSTLGSQIGLLLALSSTLPLLLPASAAHAVAPLRRLSHLESFLNDSPQLLCTRLPQLLCALRLAQVTIPSLLPSFPLV